MQKYIFFTRIKFSCVDLYIHQFSVSAAAETIMIGPWREIYETYWDADLIHVQVFYVYQFPDKS